MTDNCQSNARLSWGPSLLVSDIGHAGGLRKLTAPGCLARECPRTETDNGEKERASQVIQAQNVPCGQPSGRDSNTNPMGKLLVFLELRSV